MSDAGAPEPAPGGPWEPPPETQAFAARLVRRRRHRGLGPRCERLRWRAEAIDRFAAAREYTATLAGRVDPRWACPERDRDDIPGSVIKGMLRCQKPFHLWNVERVEHEEPFDFEPQEALRVGGAAAVPEELRVPRQVAKATRALREWLDEEAFRDTLLKMDRRRFKRLLHDPLPYGRSEDEPDDEDVVVIQPPGFGGARDVPDRVAPFVRLPAPGPRPGPELPDDDDDDAAGGAGFFGGGGFDMSQPDDDDEEDEAGGGGVGGFDMSRPDDDEDEAGGGGVGGFDMSQPDD